LDISSAYIFLMRTFEPGDRLFLFGFSRGAYTARYISAMLCAYGILPNGNEHLVQYLIRALSAAKNPQEHLLVAKVVKVFARPCESSFLGVWDTVSSVGWFQNRLMTPYMNWNPTITIGRHALAMDERRGFFMPITWGTQPPGIKEQIKEVWFPGVHSDVGGGYCEAQSGLSKVPLEWMLGEAQASGLLLDRERTELVLGEKDNSYVKPDASAAAHDSMTLAWRFLEFVPRLEWLTMRRRPNLFRRRPIGHLIHESAYQRSAEYQKRLPAYAVRVTSLPLRWPGAASREGSQKLQGGLPPGAKPEWGLP
jgi:uncharacterized protein (DUF2235 family)